MKKKFALLMCAVMLFGAMLTCIPASAAAKTEGGPLAITEVCYAPENEKYEYVEVINVSDNEVDLKNYYIYRFASASFSPSMPTNAIQQMFGYKADLNKLVRLNLATVTGDTVIAKNELAVLWFASAVSKDETVDTFKGYWANRDCDMTDVNVIKVPVYDANGTDLYPANHVNDADLMIHKDAGATFLPDGSASFVISFIHKDFGDNDTMERTASSGKKWHRDAVKEKHLAADTEALIILGSSDFKDTGVHYYEFATQARTFAAVETMRAADGYADGSGHKDIRTLYIPEGLVAFESASETEANVTLHQNTHATYTGEIFMPTFNNQYLPNPGTLYKGQFGLDGDVRVADAANGVGSLVLTGGTKPTVENLAVIEDEEDDKKSDETTAAPETTAAAPAEEKGCGSAITASALLVIAPALAAGCVVGTKKRRNRK
jgi:hypothetical protein